MALQINSNAVVNDSRKGIFLSMNVGVYTDATRPSSPSTGDVIFNSTVGNIQVYTGTSWK
jgi:hypothetical protein